MTTTADAQVTLTFTERLTVAIGRAWPTQLKAAEYLEVDRGTVTRWTKGLITPSASTLRVIASASGIPYEWLRPSPADVEKGLRPWYTPWDSNPEPTDSWTCLVDAIVSEAESILASADARQRS